MAQRDFLDSQRGRIISISVDDNGEPVIPVAKDILQIPVKQVLIKKNVGNEVHFKYEFPDSMLNIAKYGITGARVEKLIGSCMECDEPITNLGKHEYYAKNRSASMYGGMKLLCADCVKLYVKCSSCLSNYKKEDLHMDRCETCIHQAPRTLIRNYTYRLDSGPTGELKIIGKSLDEIYYGIELEYESINHGEDTVIVHDLIKEFACLKKDSSIEQGFEVVSFPCSMEKHYELWENFFNNLPETTKPLRTCGMHVHASRTRMSMLQLGKMLVFLHNPDNKQFVRLIAGRESSYHNDYESPKSIADGKKTTLGQLNQDRHTALNLNGHQTIEFRIFSATKDKKIFLKNLEFCKALIKFTDWGAHSMQEARDHCVFFNYVLKHRKEYPFLSDFLTEKVAPQMGIPFVRKPRLKK